MLFSLMELKNKDSFSALVIRLTVKTYSIQGNVNTIGWIHLFETLKFVQYVPHSLCADGKPIYITLFHMVADGVGECNIDSNVLLHCRWMLNIRISRRKHNPVDLIIFTLADFIVFISAYTFARIRVSYWFACTYSNVIRWSLVYLLLSLALIETSILHH